MVSVDRLAIRRHRHLKGLNQGELATAADISYGYVGHIERGTRKTVSPAVFGRICDALGVEDRTKLMAPEPEAAK